MQDRRGEPGRLGERRVRVQRIAVAEHPVQQGLLRQGGNRDLGVGIAVGQFGSGARPAFTAESALALGEDRRAGRPQRCAVGAGDGVLLHDHRGRTLVPQLADPAGAGRLARRRNRPVHLHLLVGVHHLGQIDVDAGEAHLRRLGLVQGLRHGREGGQHLRLAIVEVAQFGLVGPAGPRAQPQVVELHVGGGPRELAARQLRAEGDGRIDGHGEISLWIRGDGRTVPPS
ncbi:hypothetical protein CJ468_05521 [Nocardia farcinica]|nr:hypothetical protein CJ468_05521 [Nocardia farcinica]